MFSLLVSLWCSLPSVFIWLSFFLVIILNIKCSHCLLCVALRFWAIPRSRRLFREDYDDWHVVTMEVVACAELDGGYAALRIRTRRLGSLGFLTMKSMIGPGGVFPCK